MAIATLTFPPFTLDLHNTCLWRGDKQIALTAKNLAVLHYLAVHAGRLVTQAELLKAVWPDVRVSPGILRYTSGRFDALLKIPRTPPTLSRPCEDRGIGLSNQ